MPPVYIVIHDVAPFDAADNDMIQCFRLIQTDVAKHGYLPGSVVVVRSLAEKAHCHCGTCTSCPQSILMVLVLKMTLKSG
jgi:hypothetical protein